MAQPQQNGGGAPMIRPGQIDSLPHLDATRKDQYKQGLSRLWQTVHEQPEGSPLHTDALAKIRAASQKIMQDLSTSSRRPGSGGGVQGQPQQRPPTQGGQSQAVQGGPAVGQPNGGGGGGGSVQGGGQAPAWSDNTRKYISEMQIHVPFAIAGDNNAVASYRQGLVRAIGEQLDRKERAQKLGRNAQSQGQQITQSGQAMPEQIRSQMNAARNAMTEAEKKLKDLKDRNAHQGVVNQQARQAGGQQPAQADNVQAGGFQGKGAATQSQSQPGQGDVKQEQRNSMSPQQPQGGFQQQQPQQPNQGMASQTSAAPSQQPPPQTPQSAVQPQQPPQQQQPQNYAQQQFQNQQQRPPQMNTQMAQNQPPQQYTQPTPQSAVPPNSANPQQQQQQQPQRPQIPQALSHTAAVQQAQENYQRAQNQPQQQPMQQPQHLPNGHMPFNAQPPPGSATAPTPTQGFPQTQPMQPSQTPNNKFPIAKHLQLDPRTQQPVQGPPSRPTMGSQGMMTQPGLTRPQQFQLEGEGDRVLSKRKLDELVRQVTGSTSSSSEHPSLAPEVEESILHLADDFVDDLITSSCRLAKCRANQTLEVRDVQYVLERNYGIRIPGFSLDEVRTVRKFQPAAGWQSKMQAVQTAKTLGGVGKGDS